MIYLLLIIGIGLLLLGAFFMLVRSMEEQAASVRFTTSLERVERPPPPPISDGLFLAAAVSRDAFISSGDELAKVVAAKYHQKDLYHRITLDSGEEAAVGYTPGNPWLDVFARARRKADSGGRYTGNYRECGFNLEERRWSYGAGPPGAAEIRRQITRLFS